MLDVETIAAVKAKWESTAIPEMTASGGGNIYLNDIVLGGLLEAPYPSTGGESGTMPRVVYPYATIESKEDRPRWLSACGSIDFRLLKITAYGLTKEQVSAAGDAISNVIAQYQKTGAEPEYALDLENGDWMRTEPLLDSTIRTKRVNTDQIWAAVRTWRVWSSRPKGL